MAGVLVLKLENLFNDVVDLSPAERAAEFQKVLGLNLRSGVEL
jgi:hypothetical protein